MTIGDEYTIEWNEKRQKWFVKRGNETFYDKDNNWIMFNTEHEAHQFISAMEIYGYKQTGGYENER